MHSRTSFTVFTAIALLTACEPGGHEQQGTPTPTGSICPTVSSLTYENFGRDFMSRYCGECHTSTLTSARRQGAPGDHNFDTIPGIKALLPHIDTAAAAGPVASNTAMPPTGSPAPTEEERKQLGEWIACGAP